MKKEILIKSTSGIRGIIGNGLDPIKVVSYGAAFGSFLKKGKIVIGADSRTSGNMIKQAVTSGLLATGIDVIDIGIVPTPTVEIAIKELGAVGGICVTASHNTAEWNALKFFNASGEFITSKQYLALDKIFNSGKFRFQPTEGIGKLTEQTGWVEKHIRKVLKIKKLNKAGIRKRKFKVVVDAINGAGSVALPAMLEELGCKVVRLNCKGDGNFVHTPEPTPKNLASLARAVKKHRADIGLACDPDADRLALVDETGRAISEELTLTIAVMEVLRNRRGPTVINLSTSRTTADIAKSFGSPVHYAKVGEANVVALMHKRKAVIGGEGNGGVIFPECHAGRDCLVAAALVLSGLSRDKRTLSQLVETFPRYYNIKAKASLPGDFGRRLKRFEKESGKILGKCRINREDGLRFDFEDGWLQLRTSNTEPIYRLIVETNNQKKTSSLSRQVAEYFK